MVADGAGRVVLTAETGTDELMKWDTTVDPPRFESQSDGPSIRIGQKRFIISSSGQQLVDSWLDVALGRAIEAPPSGPTITSEQFAEKMLRFKSMLDDGLISREEFDTLVGQAAIHSVDPVEEMRFKAEVERREQEEELLHDFQQVWLNVVGSTPPRDPKPEDIARILVSVKKSIDDTSRNPAALINMWVSYGDYGVVSGILRMSKLEDEVKKAIKRGRALPPEVARAHSQWLSETRAKYQPLYAVARRMGFTNLPII